MFIFISDYGLIKTKTFIMFTIIGYTVSDEIQKYTYPKKKKYQIITSYAMSSVYDHN